MDISRSPPNDQNLPTVHLRSDLYLYIYIHKYKIANKQRDNHDNNMRDIVQQCRLGLNCP